MYLENSTTYFIPIYIVFTLPKAIVVTIFSSSSPNLHTYKWLNTYVYLEIERI